MESGTDIGVRSMREKDLAWVPEVENKSFPDPWVTEYYQLEFEY